MTPFERRVHFGGIKLRHIAPILASEQFPIDFLLRSSCLSGSRIQPFRGTLLGPSGIGTDSLCLCCDSPISLLICIRPNCIFIEFGSRHEPVVPLAMATCRTRSIVISQPVLISAARERPEPSNNAKTPLFSWTEMASFVAGSTRPFINSLHIVIKCRMRRLEHQPIRN